jgi:hypothetical protein
MGIRMAYKIQFMFESCDKKVVVLVFYGRFHELLPTFWVPRRFEWTVRPDTCLRVMTKNSSFCCFMALFHELLSTVLGFMGDLYGP